MNHIISARVMTRDGFHPHEAAAIIEARRQESERAQMLAAVARIEARLELERALKRSSMATPTPIQRQPGAMATRNPGKIHPAPIADTDGCAGFDRVDRVLSGVVQTLLIMAAVMTAVALAGGAA